MSINKTLSFVFFSLSIVLIINLGRDIFRLIKSEERVARGEEKLGEIEQENSDLKKTKEYYKSDQFLEEQIRNKLQMAKPGEKVLILPEELQEGTGVGEESSFGEMAEDKGELANWQKWLELFK